MNSDVSPQLEDGYTSFANELIDAFKDLDISGSQWRILMLIARKTYGYHRKVWDTSNKEMSIILKTSRNRVHENLKTLITRKILFVTENRYQRRVTIGINKHYNQWCSSPKTGTVPENRYESSPKTGTVPLRQKEKRLLSISPQKNGIPYIDIVRSWNEILGNILPKVNESLITDKRKSHILARWNTSEKTKSIEWWRSFFEDHVLTSDFLIGNIKPSPGRKQFRATFDWVFKSENFVKIVEGNYT